MSKPEEEGDPSNAPHTSKPSADPREPDSIYFDESAVSAEPGQTLTVRVSVSPPGKHSIRVALFANSPAAFLSESELETDSDGHAQFTLTVTTTSAPFFIRAYSGKKTAELSVSVSDLVVAEVQVEPVYQGTREITDWNVDFAQDADCSDNNAYFGPGRLQFTVDSRILLPTVPAQRPVTILVSSREYVFGCAVRALEPGKLNIVPVTITDRPLQLENINFPLSLSINPTPEFTTHLDAVITAMVSAFRRNDASDAATLLQQMAELSPSQEDFRAAKVRGDWETLLTEALTKDGAENGLSSRLVLWLRTGATHLSGAAEGASERVFRGQLQASDTSHAFFSLESIAGLDPSVAQMPLEYAAVVKPDGPTDVRAAFKLFLMPSLLLGALAEREAQTGGATGVVDALERSLKGVEAPQFCARVANVISSGESSSSADAGDVGSLDCDESCFEDLCHRALESRWTAARTAATYLTVVDVTAGGTPAIDDKARVKGFSGDWVGETNFLGTSLSPGMGELGVRLNGRFSSSDLD